MPGIVNFNAQLAPMEHVEKLVRQEQDHGKVKQEALMQNAAEFLKKDNETVQKTAKTRKDRKLGRKYRDDENSNRKWYSPKDGSESDSESGGESGDETPAAEAQQGELWSGNIVNIKV